MAKNPDCLFCQIISGQMKADIIERRPTAIAFRDVNPQAPDHVLIVPTDHVSSLKECDDQPLLGYLMVMAADMAKKVNIDHGGFRVVVNTGKHGGQTVDHLHIHLLGGRRMAWPPG